MAGLGDLGTQQAWYMLLHASNASAPTQQLDSKLEDKPEQQAADTENDTLFRTIVAKLGAAGTTHSLLHHRPTRTSEESAQVRGVTLDSGAKAMLVSVPANAAVGLDFALLVLSASRQLDWKAVRKALGRKTQLVSQEAVYQLTGCVPGAVPPFGSLFHAVCASSTVGTFLDPSMQEQGATMNFNAGLRTASVGMSVEDYIALEQPTVMRFSK